jgi:predicted NBD/HSP70 family sugar kinase
MSAIIGIDVGSTTMSGGLVTTEGEILATIQAPTPRNGRAMNVLLEVVDRLLVDASARSLDLLGVGVGLAGLVDAEKGMLRSSANHIPELHDLPLADRLGAHTGLAAFVDNDVNALALAESTFGLGRGASSLVVLAIGTGIGGGIILNSELVRGTSGYAGEFGHMTVNFRGPLCSVCGGRGCMAAYIDGTQLAAQARTLMAPRPGRDPEVITAAMVFEAAAAGDRLATRIVDEACEALAAGLGAIVNAFNPEIIVVTGGVAQSLVSLEADIVRRIAAHALGPALEQARIAIVPSDKRTTVLGGAALVLYELRRRDRLGAMRSDPLHSAREA